MTARNGAAHPAGMVFPTGRDVLHLFLLARFALVAWFFPEQRWRTALDLTTPFQGDVARRRKAAAHASANDRIEKALGEPLADEARSRLADEIGYREAESLLAFLRELRPGGWSPSIETRGAENIDRALTQGEGAILWIAHQKHAFAWKKALHQAGIAATHLSRSVHGLSASEFGMRYFNPLWTRVECRHLAQQFAAGLAPFVAADPAQWEWESWSEKDHG